MIPKIRNVLFAALLLAVPTVAAAGLLPPPRTYKKMDMFGNGYKDSVQKDGTWRIVANARPVDGPEFGVDMAFHRAAEMTAAAGHSHFQILDMQTTTMRVYGGDAKYTVKLIVRPSDSAETPFDCRARDKTLCVTLAAELVLARIGPTLVR